jgi:hypothetical protein
MWGLIYAEKRYGCKFTISFFYFLMSSLKTKIVQEGLSLSKVLLNYFASKKLF